MQTGLLRREAGVRETIASLRAALPRSGVYSVSPCGVGENSQFMQLTAKSSGRGMSSLVALASSRNPLHLRRVRALIATRSRSGLFWRACAARRASFGNDDRNSFDFLNDIPQAGPPLWYQHCIACHAALRATIGVCQKERALKHVKPLSCRLVFGIAAR